MLVLESYIPILLMGIRLNNVSIGIVMMTVRHTSWHSFGRISRQGHHAAADVPVVAMFLFINHAVMVFRMSFQAAVLQQRVNLWV